MTDVLRITTEFVEAEDRLRLTCALRSGDTAVLWLTQRLFLRVLPHLLEWLDQHTPGLAESPATREQADVVRSFSQEAARAAQPAEPPVLSQHATQIWLVHTVELQPRAAELRLVFRPAARDVAAGCLALAPQPLRMWLGIVADQFARAGWPLQAWPGWLRPAVSPPGRPAAEPTGEPTDEPGSAQPGAVTGTVVH